jgi:uncharacterized protein (DUF983 family)
VAASGAVSEPSPLAAAIKGQCPQCGQGRLFNGWVRFAPRCRACGLDLDSFNVGDGPAAFLILVVGAVLTVLAVVVDQTASPPWWVHLVWLPVGLALTVGGLRVAKAWLLAQEYRHRAHEGRIA